VSYPTFAELLTRHTFKSLESLAGFAVVRKALGEGAEQVDGQAGARVGDVVRDGSG
jgi:hypothetical protein